MDKRYVMSLACCIEVLTLFVLQARSSRSPVAARKLSIGRDQGER